MPVQKYNSQAASFGSRDFQRRYEPNFAWCNIVSATLMLPGLRGAWLMSSRTEIDDVIDQSGQSRTLTNKNSVTFSVKTLMPYAIIDSVANSEFSRPTEAGLEDFPLGLTIGGWLIQRS